MTIYICKDKCNHISGIFTTEEVAKTHAEKIGDIVEKWNVFETAERFRYTEDGGMYIV